MKANLRALKSDRPALTSVQPPYGVKMPEFGSVLLGRWPVMSSCAQPQEGGTPRTGHKDICSMKNRSQNKTLSYSKVLWFTGHLSVLVGSRYITPCPAPILGLPSENGPTAMDPGGPRSPSEETHLVLWLLKKPHILSTVDISGRRNTY